MRWIWLRGNARFITLFRSVSDIFGYFGFMFGHFITTFCFHRNRRRRSKYLFLNEFWMNLLCILIWMWGWRVTILDLRSTGNLFIFFGNTDTAARETKLGFILFGFQYKSFRSISAENDRLTTATSILLFCDHLLLFLDRMMRRNQWNWRHGNDDS